MYWHQLLEILHGKAAPFGQNALNLDGLFAKSTFASGRVATTSFMQIYIEIIVLLAFELRWLLKSMF
jgi:hypothetical protein